MTTNTMSSEQTHSITLNSCLNDDNKTQDRNIDDYNISEFFTPLPDLQHIPQPEEQQTKELFQQQQQHNMKNFNSFLSNSTTDNTNLSNSSHLISPSTLLTKSSSSPSLSSSSLLKLDSSSSSFSSKNNSKITSKNNNNNNNNEQYESSSKSNKTKENNSGSKKRKREQKKQFNLPKQQKQQQKEKEENETEHKKPNKKRARKNQDPRAAAYKRPSITPVCTFYLEGRCKRDNCEFRHEGTPKTKNTLCKFFLVGACSKTAEICPYSHDLSQFACKYHHRLGGCTQGDSCPFMHGDSSQLSTEQIRELDERIELTRPASGENNDSQEKTEENYDVQDSRIKHDETTTETDTIHGANISELENPFASNVFIPESKEKIEENCNSDNNHSYLSSSSSII